MERDNICCQTGSYLEEYVAKLKELMSNWRMQVAMTYALAICRQVSHLCCGGTSGTPLHRQRSIYNLCNPISSIRSLRINRFAPLQV